MRIFTENLVKMDIPLFFQNPAFVYFMAFSPYVLGLIAVVMLVVIVIELHKLIKLIQAQIDNQQTFSPSDQSVTEN